MRFPKTGRQMRDRGGYELGRSIEHRFDLDA
jgi:hypothetical protein